MDKNKAETERDALEAQTIPDALAEDGAEDGEDTEPDLVLRFAKPYRFGGVEYTEVDLSGLEDVTAGVLEAVGKIAAKKNPGINPALQEMSLTFCTYLAQRVAKLPLEFFTGLPAKEAIKLKTLVTNFLYGGDGAD